MGFHSIQNAIKTKLQSISSIQSVQDFPTEETNGYPNVLLMAKKNDSQFETTIENERVYIYKLIVNVKVADGTIDEKKARDMVLQVVDDILYAFDRDQQLSSLSLSSDETMIICQPALTDEIVSTPPYVRADMEIKVKISINITA